MALAIGIAFVIVGALALAAQFAADDGLVHGTGTVTYIEVEGGFFGIVGDDGRNYDPTNLPQEFKVDGLRVRFTAHRTDLVSFHMWGYVVRIVTIERLP